MNRRFDSCVEYFNDLILTDLNHYFEDQKPKIWIAGGAIRNYFMGIPPVKTDIDIFYSNKSFNEPEYYTGGQYALTQFMNFFQSREGYELIFSNDNAVKIRSKGITYDIIHGHEYSDPVDCIDSFDFTICQFAVDQERVYHGEHSFIDLAKRQLMINQIDFPLGTLRRTLRYTRKGFRICTGELHKIAQAINTLDEVYDIDDSQHHYYPID